MKKIVILLCFALCQQVTAQLNVEYQNGYKVGYYYASYNSNTDTGELPSKVPYMPNDSGCYDVDCAYKRGKIDGIKAYEAKTSNRQSYNYGSQAPLDQGSINTAGNAMSKLQRRYDTNVYSLQTTIDDLFSQIRNLNISDSQKEIYRKQFLECVNYLNYFRHVDAGNASDVSRVKQWLYDMANEIVQGNGEKALASIRAEKSAVIEADKVREIKEDKYLSRVEKRQASVKGISVGGLYSPNYYVGSIRFSGGTASFETEYAYNYLPDAPNEDGFDFKAITGLVNFNAIFTTNVSMIFGFGGGWIGYKKIKGYETDNFGGGGHPEYYDYSVGEKSGFTAPYQVGLEITFKNRIKLCCSYKELNGLDFMSFGPKTPGFLGVGLRYKF